ncbi:hypothetical protein B566_EDAN001145 [Ephemera danica]|nr:hypothetical protein B566_EDAN001145 [Ephemera danica]
MCPYRGVQSKSPTLTQSPTLYGDALNASLQAALAESNLPFLNNAMSTVTASSPEKGPSPSADQRSSMDGSLHIKQEPLSQTLENGGGVQGLSHLIKREMLEHGMDSDDLVDDERDFHGSGLTEHGGSGPRASRADQDGLALSMDSDMDEEDEDDVAEDLSMATDAQDEALEA